MRRSIATVSLSGMLPEKLQAIAAAGFDGVEIFENDLLQFPGKPAEIRRLAADLGLAIDMFQPFRDFDGTGDGHLRRSLDRLERKFDLMQELGTELLLVCSSVQPDAVAEVDELARQFAQLAERAARRGIRASYEALAWGTHVNRFGQAWEVVRRVDHPALGLTLDSFHTLAIGDDPRPIADLPGDRIFYVQLADAPRLQTDVLTLSRHSRCFPGQGEFDLTGFVQATLASGYAGTLSLEIFNDDFRAGPTRAYAQDGIRSLRWLEEQAGLAMRAQGLAPRAGVVLCSPAAPPRLAGWAFVEFAVEPAASDRLAGWLASLGFNRIGRHRSKNVLLFGRGEVRIVLNLEAESFARRWFELHGTSACALALLSADPAASIARAEALGWQRITGPAAEDEMPLPAVQAPDGSLLYFCGIDAQGRPDFESDFTLTEQAGVPDEGDRIDHLVHAIPRGQIHPWVLFEHAVLGLRPQRSVTLNDPQGVVRSREIESADRALRLGLMVSERDGTVVSRSLSRYGGAGLQQLAIEVPDLLATAAELRRRGTAVLPVPDNYYDDLAARYELDAAFLAALRSRGLLYERQGDAEFLHLYTAPFDDRFEVEFIERRGGYDGYGSTNGSVHLAALALWRDKGHEDAGAPI